MQQNKSVEKRNGGYYLAGTRVSLDSIIYCHLQGLSTEEIAANFPVLSNEQVKEAVTLYEANRQELDVYLREGEALFKALRQNCSTSELHRKLTQWRRPN